MIRVRLGKSQVLGLILALGLSLALWRQVFDTCPSIKSGGDNDDDDDDDDDDDASHGGYDPYH